MPVRVLYNEMKNEPVPLIADMYKNMIVPSIDEKSLRKADVGRKINQIMEY